MSQFMKQLSSQAVGIAPSRSLAVWYGLGEGCVF